MLHAFMAALAASAAPVADNTPQTERDAAARADAMIVAQTRTQPPARIQRAKPIQRITPQRVAPVSTEFHDPTSTAWRFRYGLTGNGYNSAWTGYKNQDFLPIDIETDRIGSSTRYAGVWQKNEDGRGWASWRNLTSDGFHDKWAEYKAKGYRPIDQDAEVVGGSVRYSLVMVENKEGLKWVSNRNLTSADFSAKFNQYKAQYMPIDIDAVRVGGTMRYSVIWVENKTNTPWAEVRDMTPATYGQKFQQYGDQGYRVADLDCYNAGGNLRYAAIWEKNKPGRAWAARREMSATGFSNWWKKYSDQGMRVIDIEVCPAKSGGGVQYAAVWRENDGRYDWSGRKSVENELKKFVDNSDAPSVGVAIMRNGQLIFRGGHGEADTEKHKWAHGGTIYRLASIAKAVTGTLAYDMEEAGLINLGVRTDTIVSGLGTKHTHTVRQLLRMEGCMDAYKNTNGSENATQVSYATGQAALDGFQNGRLKKNEWILSGCSMGSYNYSTHSYVPAAVALEKKGSMSFANLVKTRISDPMNLDTLRIETRTTPDPVGERAEIYAGSGRVSDANFQNITWKAPSGGMESSAIDLARFGDAVFRNRYFPQTTRDAMWVGSGNGQAAGWSNSGTQIWKTGGQQASDTYIVIDTNTGVTVVTMSNIRKPTIDTQTLANTILGIANAN